MSLCREWCEHFEGGWCHRLAKRVGFDCGSCLYEDIKFRRPKLRRCPYASWIECVCHTCTEPCLGLEHVDERPGGRHDLSAQAPSLLVRSAVHAEVQVKERRAVIKRKAVVRRRAVRLR